jgi:hypothetical protein
VIYFVLDPGLKAVKIGYTANKYTLASRLNDFKTGTASMFELIGSMDGSKDDERKIHIRFAGLHIRGEWFRDDATMREYIAKCAQNAQIRQYPERSKPGHLSFCEALWHMRLTAPELF